MIRLTLKTFPPLVNATYKSGKGRFYKTKAAKDIQDAIRWEIRSQTRYTALQGPLRLDIGFHWPDKRRRDIDSGLKSLLDCCTGLLYEDDSQIVELRVTKQTDRDNPRVIIDIYEVD